MKKDNKEEWQIEAKLNYLIGKLTGRQTDVIIKDELKNLLSSQRTKLLDEVKEGLTGKNIHYLHTGSCTKECKQIKKDLIKVIIK